MCEVEVCFYREGFWCLWETPSRGEESKSSRDFQRNKQRLLVLEVVWDAVTVRPVL